MQGEHSTVCGTGLIRFTSLDSGFCFALVASRCQGTTPALWVGTAPPQALLRTAVVKPLPARELRAAGHGLAICLRWHKDPL